MWMNVNNKPKFVRDVALFLENKENEKNLFETEKDVQDQKHDFALFLFVQAGSSRKSTLDVSLQAKLWRISLIDLFFRRKKSSKSWPDLPVNSALSFFMSGGRSRILIFSIKFHFRWNFKHRMPPLTVKNRTRAVPADLRHSRMRIDETINHMIRSRNFVPVSYLIFSNLFIAQIWDVSHSYQALMELFKALRVGRMWWGKEDKKNYF